MIFEMNVGLCTICVVLNAISLSFHTQMYRKHRAYLEKLAVRLESLLLSGLVIFLFSLFYPSLVIFHVMFVIQAVSFAIIMYGFFKFLAFSGESRPQWEKIIVAIYVTISYIVVSVFFNLNSKPQELEGHLYLGIDINIMFLAIILFGLPLLHLNIIILKYPSKIYEKALRYPLMAFINTLAAYLILVFLVLDFIDPRIYIYFPLIGAIVLLIVINRGHQNLLVDIAHVFAFKTLYIIQNNGQTIFSHEFAPIAPEIKEKNKISYLIGGFIYAISHGIKEVVRQEYETNLRVMDFGNLKMLFYYGNQVFGILFSREYNDVIYNKLKRFIDKFERVFPEIIENSTGANLIEAQPVTEKEKEAAQEILDLMKLFFRS